METTRKGGYLALGETGAYSQRDLWQAHRDGGAALVTLVGCWQAPDRSLVKASMVVGLVALSYVLSLAGSLSSTQVLQASWT